MIRFPANKQLEIIAPNTNKALAVILKEASAQEMEMLLKQKDLRSILNSFFQESAKNSDTDTILLNLAKNNPTLKELGNISITIKDLLQILKSEKTPLPLETTLKNFLLDIKDLNEKSLKQRFENSGVFFESKLKNADNPKEILSQDLKAVLLQNAQETAKYSHPNHLEIAKQVDKLLLQIDYFGLLSHLSNASSLYLPFSWDQFEEGSVTIQKDKNSVFYCDIDLRLKEYGDLTLKLALYEKNNINIHIYTQNKEFQEIVRENIASLRRALIDARVTPREIRIFDKVKKDSLSPYEISEHKIDMGFEIKA